VTAGSLGNDVNLNNCTARRQEEEKLYMKIKDGNPSSITSTRQMRAQVDTIQRKTKSRESLLIPSL
jgi:hypothetical protein